MANVVTLIDALSKSNSSARVHAACVHWEDSIHWVPSIHGRDAVGINLVLTGTELIRTVYYQLGTVNLANELLLAWCLNSDHRELLLMTSSSSVICATCYRLHACSLQVVGTWQLLQIRAFPKDLLRLTCHLSWHPQRDRPAGCHWMAIKRIRYTLSTWCRSGSCNREPVSATCGWSLLYDLWTILTVKWSEWCHQYGERPFTVATVKMKWVLCHRRRLTLAIKSIGCKAASNAFNLKVSLECFCLTNFQSDHQFDLSGPFRSFRNFSWHLDCSTFQPCKDCNSMHSVRSPRGCIWWPLDAIYALSGALESGWRSHFSREEKSVQFTAGS